MSNTKNNSLNSTENCNTIGDYKDDDDDDVLWEDGYEGLKGKDFDDNIEDRRGNRTHSARNANEDVNDGLNWQMPEDCNDLSIDVLSSLPYHIRKSLIEEARKKQRMLSRSNYLPVADNPALYSQTQLSNFLNSR